MITLWKSSRDIVERIYIPKYYDPTIRQDLAFLETTHVLRPIGDMVDTGELEVSTGDEIGKVAYGTGDIPFVRTSDISNWEIKSVPKQGVSEAVYARYSERQDVRAGDLLLVRDGTYLIGTNCLVSSLDSTLVYQSHILKLRASSARKTDAHMLFLALNTEIVQRQLRNVQFTADTIDTIGNRYREVILPLPKATPDRRRLVSATRAALGNRVLGKAFIRQAPLLIERVLREGSTTCLRRFLDSDPMAVKENLTRDTISGEFGKFSAFQLKSSKIRERVFIPKYYDPEIPRELKTLNTHCACQTIGDLVETGVLELSTGDEIGKLTYGTGNIPFLRTSDFADWEIKHDPKHGVSEDVYDRYAERQDVKANDILLVRDGTYLVGSSCIVTEADERALFCGGLYKLRAVATEELNPFLLLGLLNSYIVKRQIRTKQFTRDVIDTLGTRLYEVVLPIPRSKEVRKELAKAIRHVVQNRIRSRQRIARLAVQLASIPSCAKTRPF